MLSSIDDVDLADLNPDRKPYVPDFLTPEEAAVCPSEMYGLLDLDRPEITPLPGHPHGPGGVRLLGVMSFTTGRRHAVIDAPGVERVMLHPDPASALSGILELCRAIPDTARALEAATWLTRTWAIALLGHPDNLVPLILQLHTDLEWERASNPASDHRRRELETQLAVLQAALT